MDQPGFLSDVKAILSDMVRKGKGRDIGRAAPEGKDILREYVKNCEVIRTKHRGPLYDLEMYKTLARSKLTLNMHIGLAGGYSGNMRMYEATGSGACLVTEGFENTPELFEPGREILTYSHKEELLDKLKDIISGKKWKETGMVAKEGQKRTIRDYNMERLFEKVKPALEL
jgi:spore maturation protein CgeB